MLADDSPKAASFGSVARDIRDGIGYYERLLDFVRQQLPRWRDDPKRPCEQAEPRLTGQLCDYLNSSARLSNAWDHIQFRTEVGDPNVRGRSLDLTAQPCGAVVWIGGREHTMFDVIIPIECKRLPTPLEHERDEREYVFSKYGTRGGMQRFKVGAHGAGFELGAMIAYIQSGTVDQWIQRMTEWIGDIAQNDAAWNDRDCPSLDHHDTSVRVSRLQSVHDRPQRLPRLKLVHLWIEVP